MVAFHTRRPDRSTGGKVLTNRNPHLLRERPVALAGQSLELLALLGRDG
jgi:hypothetical protein